MKANDYCSYELSLALKKAGFDEPCDMFYTDNIKIPCSEIKPFPKPKNWNEKEGRFSVPTLYQAQKWLRSKGIDIEIRVWIVGNEREYRPYIMPPKCRDFIAYPPKKLYESALSAGIEAALELIDNEKE